MRKHWNMAKCCGQKWEKKQLSQEYWASLQKSDKGEEGKLIIGKTRYGNSMQGCNVFCGQRVSETFVGWKNMVRELSCSIWNNQREGFIRIVALNTSWPVQLGRKKDLSVRRRINGQVRN